MMSIKQNIQFFSSLLVLVSLLLSVSFSNAAVHLPPNQVSGPSDLTYDQGTTGHTLSWTYEAHESGDAPAEYNISIDGNVLSNHLKASWQDNDPITVNVDGLSLGDHTVAITIWDSGYPTDADAAQDSVTVTVVEEGSLPTSSTSEEVGLTGQLISVSLVIAITALITRFAKHR